MATRAPVRPNFFSHDARSSLCRAGKASTRVNRFSESAQAPNGSAGKPLRVSGTLRKVSESTSPPLTDSTLQVINDGRTSVLSTALMPLVAELQGQAPLVQRGGGRGVLLAADADQRAGRRGSGAKVVRARRAIHERRVPGVGRDRVANERVFKDHPLLGGDGGGDEQRRQCRGRRSSGCAWLRGWPWAGGSSSGCAYHGLKIFDGLARIGLVGSDLASQSRGGTNLVPRRFVMSMDTLEWPQCQSVLECGCPLGFPPPPKGNRNCESLH